MKGKKIQIIILTILLVGSNLVLSSESEHVSLDHISDILLDKEELPIEYKNYCLNNYPGIEKMSTKRKLLEFAKGPCSPLIILPGIMASKLRIEINCRKFKQNFPYTFQKCGWVSCKVT